MKKALFSVFMAMLMSAILGLGNANADTVTFSSGLTGNSSDPLGPILQYDGSILFPQFNPTMGILNSVTLDLSSIFNYSTQFSNNSASSSHLVINLNQQLLIGKPADTTNLSNPSNLLVTNPYTYSVNQIVSGGGSYNNSQSSPQTNTHSTVSGSNMASFIGTGNTLLDVYSYANFSFSATGGNNSLHNTQDFVTNAEVTYDFTPTPIPGAIWLFGSGLAGIVGIRKKLFK